MAKKTVGPRHSYMIREVLRIGLMVDGEPYIQSKIGRGKSCAIRMFDGASDLEEAIMAALRCEKGDEVEFVLSCRKVEK
jgi:hypothetical protein